MRPSIWMKTIFQKNLQFGDIWPRNRQKIAQIEVFGHFLDFASLDRWTWCLVVFLQFFGPINVFLLIFRLEDSYCCFIFYKFSRDLVVLRDFEEIFCQYFLNHCIICSAQKFCHYVLQWWYNYMNNTHSYSLLFQASHTSYFIYFIYLGKFWEKSYNWHIF